MRRGDAATCAESHGHLLHEAFVQIAFSTPNSEQNL